MPGLEAIGLQSIGLDRPLSITISMSPERANQDEKSFEASGPYSVSNSPESISADDRVPVTDFATIIPMISETATQDDREFSSSIAEAIISMSAESFQSDDMSPGISAGAGIFMSAQAQGGMADIEDGFSVNAGGSNISLAKAGVSADDVSFDPNAAYVISMPSEGAHQSRAFFTVDGAGIIPISSQSQSSSEEEFSVAGGEATLKMSAESAQQSEKEFVVKGGIFVWPPALPDKQFSDIKTERNKGHVRSDQESQSPNVRETTTANPQRFTLNLILDKEERKEFESFYEDQLGNGSLRFLWEDPQKDETVELRMVGRPSWKNIRAGDVSRRLWKGEIVLEKLQT